MNGIKKHSEKKNSTHGIYMFISLFLLWSKHIKMYRKKIKKEKVHNVFQFFACPCTYSFLLRKMFELNSPSETCLKNKT